MRSCILKWLRHLRPDDEAAEQLLRRWLPTGRLPTIPPPRESAPLPWEYIINCWAMAITGMTKDYTWSWAAFLQSFGLFFLINYLHEWTFYRVKHPQIQQSKDISTWLLLNFFFFFLVGWSEGFPGGSDGKESACNEGDLSSIPGLEDPLEKEMAPTSLLLSGKFHGRRSLVGHSPWGHKELDTTERLHFTS